MFVADAAIDHIVNGFTIVHAHVVFDLKAPNMSLQTLFVTALYHMFIWLFS